MKKILAFLACAATILIGAHFLMGPVEAQFISGLQTQDRPVDNVTTVLDSNKDRKLSESELANAPKVLKSLDRNRDGKLTEDEIFGPPNGGPGGPVDGSQRDLIAEFDENENGRLEKKERLAALADLKANPLPRRRRGPPGGGGGVTTKPGRKVARDGVKSFADKLLYDDTVMRTFFIDFEDENWEKEMGALKDFGVDIPATVTVDGNSFEDVGVRFRGNSSFFTVQEGQKRSLNLSFDWANKSQDLYGYRTLNLLNSHSDASFLRLALYSKIARNYIPTPKASYVHVVINGESWGVYVNEEQFNSDFTKEHFGSTGGSRLKSPPGGDGGASFTYNGEDKSAYAAYEWKTKQTDEALADLINATRTIKEAKKGEIESKVDEVLSIDRVMWFLAIDNVLLDMDGYHARGADYVIYQEPKFDRFHILPYDNNETFRAVGGGGPGFGGRGGRGRGGRGGRGGPPNGGPPRGGPPRGGPPSGGGLFGGSKASFELDIFAGKDEVRAPFINKLMLDPAVKSRYVAHVRTIRDTWMDWDKVLPTITEYRNLIGAEIEKDTRKLTSTQAYNDGIGMGKSSGRNVQPGLKAFFEERKLYLSTVKELNATYPEFATTDVGFAGSDDELAVTISAKLKDKKVQGKVSAFVYFATDRLAKYTRIEMSGDGGNFKAELPKLSRGTTIYYYLEARAVDGEKFVSSFLPALAERKPDSMIIEPNRVDTPSVVINEVMASNETTIADSNGKYGDWIELANVSKEAVDLSEKYLTDDATKPKKWKFPAGTKIDAGGLLLVWADGTSPKKNKKNKTEKELHANFKLSKFAETVSLYGFEKSGKPFQVDSLTFSQAQTDRSVGRNSDGIIVTLKPSPGMNNVK